MKVYFSAAMTRYRKLLPIYKSLAGIIEDLGHEIISDHVVSSETTNGEWIAGYNPKELWKREIKRLDKADILISEVTTPSFGVSFIMEEAIKKNKPQLSLYYALPFQKDELPLMLRGKPEINFQIYTEENAKIVLKNFFNGLKQ